MHPRQRQCACALAGFCICVALVVGPILIGAGVFLFKAAKRDDRGHAIADVQAAVDRWNDSSHPDGWRRFQQLSLLALLSPSPVPGAEAIPAACTNMTLQFKPTLIPPDTYTDEAARFQPAPQLRLQASVSYADFTLCGMQVTLMQQLPNTSTPVLLATLPFVDQLASYRVDLYTAVGPKSCRRTSKDKCTNNRHAGCQYNCEVTFGGIYSCDSSAMDRCFIQNARYDDLAVKVSYANTSSLYVLDYTKPASGAGANVLPAGYSHTSGYSSDDLFQLSNIRPGALPGVTPLSPALPSWLNASGLVTDPGKGGNLTLTVRSAADPWLAYMAATEGSGNFGLSKSTLNKAASASMTVGLLLELGWLVPLIVLFVYLRNRRAAPPPTSAVANPAQPAVSPYAPPVYGVPAYNAYATYAPNNPQPTERDGLLSTQPHSSDPAAAAAPTGNPLPAGYRYPPPYGQEGQQQQQQPSGYRYAPAGAGAGPNPGSNPAGGNVEMVQGGYGGYGAYGYGYPPTAADTAGGAQQAAQYAPYPQALYGYPPAATQSQQQGPGQPK